MQWIDAEGARPTPPPPRRQCAEAGQAAEPPVPRRAHAIELRGDAPGTPARLQLARQIAGARCDDQRRLLAMRADADGEAVITQRQAMSERQGEAPDAPLRPQHRQLVEQGGALALLA